ncbi:chromosome partitioning protein ParA [Sphingorhabdus lutea]|uniref:Iron-sulfur cluster carrier protein n=1 Tax=Sphingorhabdus lutea TaxID=1913578 RepID=A0A1L3JAH2_9SPHN|nr:Mrp/NBP35 family ATP-binding protein [Sphingorhabdus lutea]APG62118.1 chromosome partitioning protein ParA [Sphingorhabdus lutea]
MTKITHITKLAEDIAPGRTSGMRLKENILSFILDIGGMDRTARETMEEKLRHNLGAVDEVDEIKIIQTSEKRPITIIAVGSGKGGVGKSTLSANLAIALKRAGKNVGMVDADIYGPSQPRLLNMEDEKPKAEDKKLIPVMNDFGIPMLSMGQLAKPGQAIAWRGPMAGNALHQLIDAHWGDTDLLIVDLPPGTGDVQLSMVQKHKPDAALIISTPQDLALIDAARAINFFDAAKVPIIGLVENMAGYLCPHCGEVSDPFGKGGAEAAADKMQLPFLGRIPLDMSIRMASDDGTPPALEDGPIGKGFAAIAHKVTTWLDEKNK